MSKKTFQIALIIVVGTIAVLSGIGTCIVTTALDYPDERRGGSGEEVIVNVEPRMSFSAIAQRLHEQGVVDRPTWFRLYAMHRGVTNRVQAGEYALTDNMSPRQVLDRLLEGVQQQTIEVVLKEGLNMLEVFDTLAQAGVIADREAIEKLARDPGFLESHGIVGETVEGYLFPDTYRFIENSDPSKVLNVMIQQHRVVWDRVRRQHDKSMRKLRDKLGWSDYDFVIMASIVEKEAVVDDERARIAQVFINRLSDGRFTPRRLETDPTIRYGCMVPLTKSAACQKWDKTNRLRRAQLDDQDNPYNTYRHEGLPPGPICSPGQKALAATFAPDGSNYFYFVARKDKRTHVFSRSLAEHERAVTKYQR